MLNALQAKRKTCFINGTLKKPDATDSNYENWITVNLMVIGWIRAADPKVKSIVTYVLEAHQLWSELKERFSVGNTVCVHQVKMQLASCRQNGRPVIDYYGQLCSYWEELQMYQKVLSCTCGGAGEIIKEREEDKLHQFLIGLDDAKFEHICTNLIGTDPMPSLAEAYSKVVREERHLVSAHEREVHQNQVGFATQFTDNRESSSINQESILKNRDITCTHCGRSGHEKSGCWQIIGYPDWWTERATRQDRGKSNSRRRGRGGAGNGRGKDHNLTLVAHVTSSNSSAFPDFTADQWK